MKKKVILVLSLSAIFALFLFYSIMSWYLTNYDPFTRWSNNQLNSLNSSEKIYILGSSQVASLNLEYIENYLNVDKKNYLVYNLAQGSDLPSLRLGDIDKIITLNPSMVVYGVGLRDFESRQHYGLSPLGTTQITSDNIFPTPQIINEKTELTLKENDFINEIFKSPQVVTLRLFNFLIRGDLGYNYPDIELQTPLIQSGITPVILNAEIKEKSVRESFSFGGLDQIENNLEFMAFNKILYKLQNAGIPIIVYVVPHNQAHLDVISIDDVELFKTTMEQVTTQNNVPLYYIYDKYVDLEIWGDIYHVAYNNNTLIYSNDVAEIIKNEINS